MLKPVTVKGQHNHFTYIAHYIEKEETDKCGKEDDLQTSISWVSVEDSTLKCDNCNCQEILEVAKARQTRQLCCDNYMNMQTTCCRLCEWLTKDGKEEKCVGQYFDCLMRYFRVIVLNCIIFLLFSFAIYAYYNMHVMVRIYACHGNLKT